MEMKRLSLAQAPVQKYPETPAITIEVLTSSTVNQIKFILKAQTAAGRIRAIQKRLSETKRLLD